MTSASCSISSPESTAPDIMVARRVISDEAAALRALAEALEDTFSKAVDLLENAQGRVIVTGMGKSGHVAGKIAATLSSTGTPAFFVHPGEASHGDLGMIRAGDAVLALSNSGETTEIADIVAYTRRFGIPLIAMTQRANSALGLAADVTLLLPNLREACPNGIAPTTSTTMLMALGDALASALLSRKGFSAEDFQVFHPGGSLGQKLRRVRDAMHTVLPLVPLGTLMDEALLAMTSSTFGCVGITDKTGLLMGIITDGDLRRHMSSTLLHTPVDDVMTRNPRVVGPDVLVGEALHMMNEKKITCLFVTENQRPIGFVRMHDCLQEGIFQKAT